MLDYSYGFCACLSMKIFSFEHPWAYGSKSDFIYSICICVSHIKNKNYWDNGILSTGWTEKASSVSIIVKIGFLSSVNPGSPPCLPWCSPQETDSSEEHGAPLVWLVLPCPLASRLLTHTTHSSSPQPGFPSGWTRLGQCCLCSYPFWCSFQNGHYHWDHQMSHFNDLWESTMNTGLQKRV